MKSRVRLGLLALRHALISQAAERAHTPMEERP
jgi:hypothetical protein